MSTLIKAQDIRTIAAGINVSRAAAVLPQGAAASIFTITGGRIKLISIVGEVTTVLTATATTLKLTSTPAVGSALDLCIASAAFASAAVGVHVTLPAAVGSALVTDITVGGGVPFQPTPYVIPAGAITLTTVGSNATGQMKWDLIYVPLDIGAAVVAA